MMDLNTKQVVDILQHAGITDSEQVVLRWVREGKINGKIESRKGGYRFSERDVQLFVEEFKLHNRPNILEELLQLKEENKRLHEMFHSSPILLLKENKALLKELREVKKELRELKEEIEESDT